MEYYVDSMNVAKHTKSAFTESHYLYATGGPYDVFAGKDATRGLATFKLKSSSIEDAKCSCDLSQRHIDAAKRWDKTFRRQFLSLCSISM